MPRPEIIRQRLAHLGNLGATSRPRSVPIEHDDDEHGPGWLYLESEILVDEEDVDRVMGRVGGQLTGPSRRPMPRRVRAFALPAGVDAFDVAEGLSEDGRRLASPHLVLSLAPHWSWGSATDPQPAPPLGEAAHNLNGRPVAAVVDTGMFRPLPRSLGVSIYETDPIDTHPPKRIVDWFGAGHGGFVAGVIDHWAKGTDIRVYRGFDVEVALPTEAAVIAGIDRALDGGATVVNASVGTYGPYGDPPVALTRAMRRWKEQVPDLLLVAAAGNDEMDLPWFPAGYAGIDEFADWVVSVGAVDANGDDAAFSNRGEWVNAKAPGVDVHSHYPRGYGFTKSGGGVDWFPDGYAIWSGTSFAAPYALAAILRAAEKGGVTPLEAWTRMRTAGTPVTF